MKKLNEVIKAYEICADDKIEDCKGCPYSGETGNASCYGADHDDALYYLKEYRDAKDTLEREKDGYAEAVRNCELAENRYRRFVEDYAKEKDEEFRNTLREMSPLTWDELRKMEGKPVWIDSVPQIRRWVIIKKFHPIGGNKNLFDMEVEDGAHFLRKNMKRDNPAWWLAYRKERE